MTSLRKAPLRLSKDLIEKAKQIKCLLLDVDGVMTNGMLYFDENGKEIKGFSIYDGLGIARCRNASILVAIISGRHSKVLTWRAKELRIEDVYQGVRDKVKAYQQIAKKYQLEKESVAFIGDDLIDLPLLRQVGLSVAVANAVDEVKKRVDWVTQRRGGEGAVREVVDFILSAQGIH
ncbi:MAG: HAD hydrolase family protein [Nitrospira sp.]|nr:3-deoxy-D-manno-octulosonate 8-phosphate phosphatase [Candidatus Manganitrophaceae bacterium]HIL34639.1 3-deoxy-D-manno-octulosonate 8-phosphate phosphatase [Candidatus Manganitrophaceae bacterium]